MARKVQIVVSSFLLAVGCTMAGKLGSDSVLAASSVVAEKESPQVYLDQGWLAFQRGELEQAVIFWQKAAEGFRDAQKPQEEVEVLIYLAHAYQLMGRYQNSEKSLAVAVILGEKLSDPNLRAALLQGLGNLSVALGSWDNASRSLNEALRFARDGGNRSLIASIQNDIGNLGTGQQKYDEALDAYVESAKMADAAGNKALAAKAWINASMAASQARDYQKSEEQLDTGLQAGRGLVASYDKVYALINAGLAYEELSRRNQAERARLLKTAVQALNDSLATAGSLGDRRGESYALGNLGKLYEAEGRYDEALTLTSRAIFAAQQANAPEALYRWEWQTGRLLKSQEKIEDAIDAYRRAVRTLQSIRQELSAAFTTQRVSFRESVGPVYFELVDLLLRHPAVLANSDQSQSLLKEAGGTVELFKAAELRDYFHDDCVDHALAQKKNVDTVAPNAFVVYPIILPDRLELLVTVAGRLKKTTVDVKADVLTQEVREFRNKLEKRTTYEFLPHAQKLYDWLIRPLEPELESVKLDALVFVPDGALRTIPMAALHDGKQFLIAKYPTAITPGLDLTDPRPLRREKVNVLAVGLTEAVQGFPPLPYVAAELESIRRLYGGNPLVNQDYLVPRVENALKETPVNIVHVASHGQFSSDATKTFLLTFDGKLTMDRLDQYIGIFRFRDDPLELLTLSACETAAGDDRAALGLAGIAIKAGARSALATLWSINDQSTAILITEFYQQLKDPSVSRAVALQRAQIKLLDDLRYQHPGYWSPFLLINNWL
jgi:CHAT domain-containing protein